MHTVLNTAYREREDRRKGAADRKTENERETTKEERAEHEK